MIINWPDLLSKLRYPYLAFIFKLGSSSDSLAVALTCFASSIRHGWPVPTVSYHAGYVEVFSSHIFSGEGGDEGSPHEHTEYCFDACDYRIDAWFRGISSVSWRGRGDYAEIEIFKKTDILLRFFHSLAKKVQKSKNNCK
jgi:hypothetical protein